MSTICQSCRRLFRDPVALKCGHRLCRSCLNLYTTKTITCPTCQSISHRHEISDDKDMENRIAALRVTCTQCDWTGCYSEFEAHNTVSHLSETSNNNESPQHIETSISTYLIQYPFHSRGCANSFPSSEVPRRTPSQTPFRGSVYDAAREMIRRADRNPDYHSNIQALGAEAQLHESAISQLPGVLGRSFSSDDILHRTERDRGPPVDQHNNNQRDVCKHLTHSNGIIQGLLENAFTSKGSIFWQWRNNDIKKMLNDRTDKTQSVFNLLALSIPINGCKLQACLYLNDNNHPTFISVHIHLDYPGHDVCHSQMKVILVDESTNHSLNHIRKECLKLTIGDNCFDCVDFIPIHELYAQGNRYMFDGSIRILFQVEQNDKGKLANLNASVKDALGIT